MRPDLTRRHALQTLAAGFASSSIISVLSPNVALAEDSFVVASTGGGTGEGVRDAFIQAPKLQERFKTPVRQSFQLDSIAASKMLAQPDNLPFSISTQAESAAMLLADNNIVQAYDLNLVPNYQDVVSTAKLGPRNGMDAWYASYSLLIFALTYNTKHVSAEPASYEELWSSKYRGKVGIPAYGWFGMMWLHQINRNLGGTEEDTSRAIDAIAKLVKDNRPVILENSDQAFQAFQREEVVIAPYLNGRTFSLQSKGVPVKMAYVPGTTTIGNGFMISKNTKYLDLANAFINATLDPEFQVIMSKRLGYPPTNKKAVLPTDMASSIPGEKDLEHAIKLDWNKINEGRDANLERWNKVVLGG